MKFESAVAPDAVARLMAIATRQDAFSLREASRRLRNVMIVNANQLKLENLLTYATDLKLDVDK